MANGLRRGSDLASGWGLLAIVATGLVVGCSDVGDQKATAKVTGRVMYEGKPVPGGSLMFSPVRDAKTPMSGKAGQAVVKSDGTYFVTTYANGDGAVVGKHQVSFSPPAMAQTEAPAGAHVQTAAAESPYAGLTPKQTDVSVVKGENKIDIELVKAAASPAAPGAAPAPAAAHSN